VSVCGSVESTLGKDEVIGLSSWSATLLAMVDAMRPLSRPTVSHVVQILGGLGNPSASIYASRLTERFAYLVKGTAVYLPAPGVTTSKEAHDSFVHDTYVSHAVAYFDKLTLALVGIGSLEPSILLSRSGNVFSIEELETLRTANAVGDMCLRFFDCDGKHIQSELDERVFGIDPDHLKKVRRSVGIAGGRRTEKAIRAAIVGHWINVLITDRCTAEFLLR
jgi:DNA-binding transcriptional regulator LsrR (DeoR family)